MSFEIIRGTYASAFPDLTQEAVNETIDKALELAREKHPDWLHFEPGIEQLSMVYFCFYARFPLDDYLEALYCAVKHGDFARRWRSVLRRARAEAAAVQ